MQMYIRARKLDGDEALRAHVERRLRFVLSRFGERIGRVTVGAILLSLRGSGNTTGGSIVDETESP